MLTMDPIVQCAACGAKLRVKAASLKVLKQVRCGKCQTMIEIPESLKNGSPLPEETVVTPTTLPRPSPVLVQPSVTPPAPAPLSVPVVPAPADVPDQKPTPSPVPQLRRPLYPESAVAPSAQQHNYSASNPPSIDTALVVRMEALEDKVNAQQENIALLTAQLRQIVKAQATAVAASQAILDR